MDNLAAVDQAVDKGDDARGVRENIGPLGEGLVGGEHDGLERLVAPGDDLEEQIGVAAVVGQVADLVDAQKLRVSVVAQPAMQLSWLPRPSAVTQPRGSHGEGLQAPE